MRPQRAPADEFARARPSSRACRRARAHTAERALHASCARGRRGRACAAWARAGRERARSAERALARERARAPRARECGLGRAHADEHAREYDLLRARMPTSAHAGAVECARVRPTEGARAWTHDRVRPRARTCRRARVRTTITFLLSCTEWFQGYKRRSALDARARPGMLRFVEEPLDAASTVDDAPEDATTRASDVRQVVAELSGTPASDVEWDAPLHSLLDSLASVEFLSRLQRGSCLPLPSSLLVDHPTLGAMQDALGAMHGGSFVHDKVPTPPPQPPASLMRGLALGLLPGFDGSHFHLKAVEAYLATALLPLPVRCTTHVGVDADAPTRDEWLTTAARRILSDMARATAGGGALCVALLGYSAGASLAPLLVRALRARAEVAVDAVVLIDPGFLDCGAAVGAAQHAGVRVIATSVVGVDDPVDLGSDDSPNALDVDLMRALLLETFPTYAARFSAARVMEETLLRGLRVDEEARQLLRSIPTLLLISTRHHAYLSCIAGGRRAEEDWTALVPHAIVQRIADVDHVDVPYAWETAWNVGHFLCSSMRAACHPEQVVAGRDAFRAVLASMRAVQTEFRAAFRRAHASVDLRRQAGASAAAARGDLAVCSRAAYASLKTQSAASFWGAVARRQLHWFNGGRHAWLRRDDETTWNGWRVDAHATPVHDDAPWDSDRDDPWSSVCVGATESGGAAGLTSWFVDARTNVAANELDLRLLEGEAAAGGEVAGTHVALLLEAPEREARTVALASLVAHTLEAAGALRGVVEAEGRAALLLPNGAAAVACIGACKRLGVTYTAIAAGAAAASVASRVLDFAPRTVITCDALRGAVDAALVDPLLAAHAPPEVVVVLDDAEGGGVRETPSCAMSPADVVRQAWARGDAPRPVDASHPLFVLYTSGSTGKPKGIVHVHGGYAVGLLATSRTVVGLGSVAEDCLFVVATPGWITGQSYMIAAALLTRTPSVLLEGSPVAPPDRFAAVIARHRVSVLKAGSTFLRMLMMRPDAAPLLRAHDVSSLRLGTFCAEPVNDAVHRFAMQHLASQYINSYWATEHGGIVWSRCHGNADQPLHSRHAHVAAALGGRRRLCARRRCRGGRRRKVARRRPGRGGRGGHPAALPVPGTHRVEDALVVGQGHWRWRRPSGGGATFDRTSATCKEMLRRAHSDGAYTFHGRSDEVINVGGNRIGTAEIESAILAAQEALEARGEPRTLANCAVVGVSDALLGTVPWAFVVPRNGGPEEAMTPQDEGAVRAAVRTRLGDAAMPQRFVAVPELPETHSGKLVRALMRALANATTEDEAQEATQRAMATLRNAHCVSALRIALARARAASDEARGGAASFPPPSLSSSTRVESEEEVRHRVRACVIALTGQASLSASSPLMDHGLDSLGATHLATRLSEEMGVALSSTLVFECGTIEGIVAHLRQHPTRAPVIPGAPALVVQGRDASCAMGTLCAGRLPRGVDAVACSSGADALAPGLPLARRELALATDGMDLASLEARRVMHGGFLRGAQLFDASAFGLAPQETWCMDPQQRALLEVGAAALVREEVKGPPPPPVGVFVGIEIQDFERMLALRPTSVFSATGFSLSVASGRLSFSLDLHGPCVAYATACSASLVACHSAHEAWRAARCGSAVAAGVNLILWPAIATMLAKAGMTSPRGRCHTWDARADGYARGEACVAVYLSSQPTPLRTSTSYLAGGAVRCDGRSASLTAPNARAQQALLEEALSDATTRADGVCGAECHGTGTALGDPIEASSYGAVVGRARGDGGASGIVLSATKANVGHGEPAAGLAGMLLAACVRHGTGTAPAAAQLRVQNPHLGEQHLAVRPVTQAGAYFELAAAATALGVSSFGYSGTIAHQVLARPPSPRVPHPAHGSRAATRLPTMRRRRSWAWSEAPASSFGWASSACCGGAPTSVVVAQGTTALATQAALWTMLGKAADDVLADGRAGDGWCVSNDAPLMDAGLDSLGATELQSCLQAILDEGGGASSSRLPATLVFDAPTLRLLHAHLWAILAPRGMVDPSSLPRRQDARAASAASAENAPAPIAVCASAWRLPAGVEAGGDAFHRMLQSGADAVEQVPVTRWWVDAGARPPLRHGAFVRCVEWFDAAAFHVSPAEACVMDPQQRLLLEYGRAALTGGGVHEDVGVFVGMEYFDFGAVLGRSPSRHSVYAANSGGMAAGRLSFVLGLHGACHLVGGTCASGLVACGLARAHALEDWGLVGSSSSALASAVSLMLQPDNHLLHARTGGLSARGRCHTWDARADGFARGEAVIAVLVQSEARPGSARLLATRTMCDGRSASFTAPNGAAQRRLLHATTAASAATRIGTYEAHGTGTRLGDPIEMGSVSATVATGTRGFDDGDAVMTMGGVKASVAHVEPAAGLAGLLVATWAAPNAQLRLMNEHVIHATAATNCLVAGAVLPRRRIAVAGGERLWHQRHDFARGARDDDRVQGHGAGSKDHRRLPRVDATRAIWMGRA